MTIDTYLTVHGSDLWKFLIGAFWSGDIAFTYISENITQNFNDNAGEPQQPHGVMICLNI